MNPETRTPEDDSLWPFGEPDDTELEAALRRVHYVEEQNVLRASEDRRK